MSSTSRVIAIAKTPSENASRRLGLMRKGSPAPRGLLSDRPADALEQLDHVLVRASGGALHPELAGAIGGDVRVERAPLDLGGLLLGCGRGELGMQEAAVAREAAAGSGGRDE